MVAASAASYSSVNQYGNRSWRYLNTCSSCDSMDGSRSMQTINNRHHCHRSTHQQYYHTRKPALKRQKRCTFATTTMVAEATGHSRTSDIAGTEIYINMQWICVFETHFTMESIGRDGCCVGWWWWWWHSHCATHTHRHTIEIKILLQNYQNGIGQFM